MGTISSINTALQSVANDMGVTYKRGRVEDLNPETVQVNYPLIWCFPFTNTGAFTENERLVKTVQVSLAFIDISNTNLDRTAETDLVRTSDMEDLADEFIYRFNQTNQDWQIDNLGGAETPLDNRYSHVISSYTLTFNININTGVCFG